MVSIGASDEPFRELSKDGGAVIVTLFGFELEATLANGVDEVGQVDGAHELCLFVERILDRMGAVASPLVSAEHSSTGGVTHPSLDLTMVNVTPFGTGAVRVAGGDGVIRATDPTEIAFSILRAEAHGIVTLAVLKLYGDAVGCASVILNHPCIIAKEDGGGLRGGGGQQESGSGEETAEHGEMS